MGLLLGLQNEADDVARRAQTQEALANRRVAGYNTNVTEMTSTLAPKQKIVEDFNTIVAQYNTDVGAYNAGYLTGNGVNTFSQWQPGYKTDKEYWMPSNLAPGNPNGYYQTVLAPANYTKTKVGAFRDGTPIYSFNSIANKPVAPDSTAATAANTFLMNQKGAIDTLNAKGESVTARNDQTQKRAALEAERFNTSIDMQKRAIQEAVVPQQSTSVFDQNMAGIHQSISDWLNA